MRPVNCFYLFIYLFITFNHYCIYLSLYYMNILLAVLIFLIFIFIIIMTVRNNMLSFN